MTTGRYSRRIRKGRSLGLLGISLLTMAVVIAGMIMYIGKQTAAMEQARQLRQLREEKEALENKHRLLASQVALLEKSDRIRRLASENLAMFCPASRATDLQSVHFVSADTAARGSGRHVGVLASGIIGR